MTTYEALSLVFTFLAFAVSVVAIFMAGRASVINKNMFKRQGIIDLHMAWQNVNDVDPVALIGPDVVKAVNALALTASLWNHDVIEKSILYQTYWTPYRDIYDKLVSLDSLVPGLNKSCRSLITSEIRKAYRDMSDTDLATVTQTII
ncbi:hypothetical protein [Pedobacter ginsengisoli]|nr:hypothetical protein [Pedobacter ginsengisoli]